MIGEVVFGLKQVMTFLPYLVLGFALKSDSCKCAIEKRMNTEKGVNHRSICPKLYAM